jgi:hypothetical protein
MFIVAVTLGLLAVMGVYGLTATSADIRAAGHMREALQAQKAGEYSMVMTAEMFNPTAAQRLVTNLNDPLAQAKDCVTAAPYTGATLTRDAEACIRLDPARMTTVANSMNPATPWAVSGVGAAPGFTLQSFGNAANQPYISVEVTNPTKTESTIGNSQTVTYHQVTVTVLVQLKPVPNAPADTLVAGRGRLTVGPSLAGGGQAAIFP